MVVQVIGVRRNTDGLRLRYRWRCRPSLMVAEIGSSAYARLSPRRLTALESSCDDRDSNFVTECVIDHRSEDDVRVLVRSSLDQICGSGDLEQTKIRTACNGQQHTMGTFDAGLEQRRGHGRFRSSPCAILATC